MDTIYLFPRILDASNPEREEIGAKRLQSFVFLNSVVFLTSSLC